MKRPIITIHGGEPQFSYKHYIAFLKRTKITKINWNRIKTGGGVGKNQFRSN